MILNGWQRIQQLEGSALPSFGTQVKYRKGENLTFYWSSFIGTNDPDSTRRIRYFNNFYSQFQVAQKFGIIAGLDIGLQQQTKKSATYDLWYSPVLIGQWSFHPCWKAAVRIEYYRAEAGIIISSASTKGFRTTGFSLNFDYAPISNIICRLEGRWMNVKTKYLKRTACRAIVI